MAVCAKDNLSRIVFCGVNNLAIFRQNVNMPLDNVSGVVESFDIRSTLETALRLHPETKTVFIIEDVRRAQEEGAGLFLHKPLTIESLADAVHAALRGAGPAIPSPSHIKPRGEAS